MKMLKSKSFRFSFLMSFIVCFFGVLNGFERTVVGALVPAFGLLLGYGSAMSFRRWRGDFRK